MLEKKSLIILIIFIFSCCLLEVKADEKVTSQDIIDDYKVYVDDSEINNYDLVYDQDIKITQVYNGGNEGYTFDNADEFIIDYSNNLYGEYSYRFNLFYYEEIIDSKMISINYVGDNNSIINTNGIYYKDNKYYILGNVNSELTVLDVINMFNNDLDMYNASLSVINNQGIELSSSDNVENGCKLKLSATYIEYGNINEINDYFDINIVLDVNKDGNIDNFDIKGMIVNSILETGNNFFNLKDAIGLGVSEVVKASDILNRNIEYKEQVYVDDIFEVKYYINGFSNDMLGGVIGKINYDKNILELVSIDIDSVYGMYNDDGKFVYLLDNYNKDGLFFTIRFKAIKEGEVRVWLDEMEVITSLGDCAILNDALFEGNITVLGYGKGGDVEKDKLIEENNISKEEVILTNREEKVNNVIEVYEELFPARDVEYISLSNDNSIKKLEIKGYDIDFDKDVLEYSIKVSSDVSKLEFDIELSDSEAFYTVVGNESFKSGKNKVLITVTSLDGSTRTYTINVEKDENISLSEEQEQDRSSSRNVIILLIILVIIGLLYIIFSDDGDTV